MGRTRLMPVQKRAKILTNIRVIQYSEEGNVMMKIVLIAAITGVFIALAAVSAQASLVPMSWGFPSFDQTSTLSQFENSVATASDVEAASVAFPTTESDSILGTSFPTITQTTDQSQLLSSVKSLNQQESQRFSYPFLSIGYSQIPSMGFL